MSDVKLINIPFIGISLLTVLGILLGYHTPIDTKHILWAFFALISLVIYSWWHSKSMFRKGYAFSFLVILTFIVFGITLVKIHNPKQYQTHYTKAVYHEIKKSEVGIRFFIKKQLKPSLYYHKYIISLQYVKNKVAQGKLLLKIPKDSTNNPLDIGNIYTARAQLTSIPKPLNPYQYDYSKYLSKQYVFHQVTITKDQLLNNKTFEWSVFRIADQLRKKINQKLQKHSFSKKELSVINALLLGQKQHISKETFEDYRDAGVIHILAVSGLHVGILLLLINPLLLIIERHIKHGKIIRLALTLLILWSFAIITGLSPSVLRAVTMFSFLAIGLQFRSKTSIYNSLFISAFILLCCDPLLIFAVGFQLSYLAVFAIVWLQPILERLFRPRFYITKKLWATFTVTIAAQLGLLPLTLFYFHQFPVLFFISNLIIIPFLGVLLGFGILTILLAVLDFLPQNMAILFGTSIDLMNTIIHKIAQQEAFVITNISCSAQTAMILYFVIISSVLILKKYNKKRLYKLILGLLTLLCILVFEHKKTFANQELVVFNNRYHTILGVLHHQELKIYSKDSIPKTTKQFLFDQYLIQNHADLNDYDQLKNVYQYKQKVILVIDNAAIYRIKALNPEIIVLSKSPKIHLDRVIDSLKPRLIIADASNYKSYLDQWELSCKKRKIPFHRTDKKGAFILK